MPAIPEDEVNDENNVKTKGLAQSVELTGLEEGSSSAGMERPSLSPVGAKRSWSFTSFRNRSRNNSNAQGDSQLFEDIAGRLHRAMTFSPSTPANTPAVLTFEHLTVTTRSKPVKVSPLV